jgi:hypothetical protein
VRQHSRRNTVMVPQHIQHQLAVGSPVTLPWSSAGAVCTATGGTGVAPWTDTLGGAGSGSLIVTSTYAGTITYGINCDDQLASAVVTYVAAPSRRLWARPAGRRAKQDSRLSLYGTSQISMPPCFEQARFRSLVPVKKPSWQRAAECGWSRR